MLSKESKIRVLENFYALDYALFGKPAAKMEACCPALLEDHINVKGALMSIMVEMYKLVDFTPPELTEQVNTKSLIASARESAKIARENSQKLVSTEQGRADVKAELRNVIVSEENMGSMEDLVQDKIREKAFGLAVDNLLIARTLSECDQSQMKKLNDWEGRLIEDAYKILRDNLVESAIDILNTNDITV